MPDAPSVPMIVAHAHHHPGTPPETAVYFSPIQEQSGSWRNSAPPHKHTERGSEGDVSGTQVFCSTDGAADLG